MPLLLTDADNPIHHHPLIPVIKALGNHVQRLCTFCSCMLTRFAGVLIFFL